MTMFQLFRLWARRAPVGERVSAGAAIAVSLALILWLANPGGGSSTSTDQSALGTSDAAVVGSSQQAQVPAGVSGSTAATTGSGVTGSLPAGSVTGPGAAALGGSRAGAGGTRTGVASGHQGSAACVAPPGTDQGVTAGGIKVAVLVLSIGGAVGNSTYGVPTPAQQEANFQKVADAINATGGIACRKVLPVYFEANPVDSASLQQLCLDVVAAHPFFMFEGAGYGYVYPSLLNCYVQNHIPFLSPTFSNAAAIQQWYPYAFFQMQSDADYHNLIFALNQRGWFSAASGFKKLGVVYQNCDKQIPTEFFAWLHQAGLSASQVDSYNLGCSDLFSPPSVLEQSILQFQRDGVTNVTFAWDERDFANYTKIAEQQHFRPKYAFADETQVAVTYSNNSPDHNNIANAIAIENGADGEEHTPGMSPSAATQKCLAIFHDKVSYPVSSYSVMSREGEEGGYCAELWQFRAMVDNAPALQRAALAAGLQATRTLDLPYPYAPADFSAARTTWGGQYWRVDQFTPSCDCWRLIDKAFHPQL